MQIQSEDFHRKLHVVVVHLIINANNYVQCSKCRRTFSDGGRPNLLICVNLYKRQFEGRRLLKESFEVALHLRHCEGELQILHKDTQT